MNNDGLNWNWPDVSEKNWFWNYVFFREKINSKIKPEWIF
jgi:hypothetical protein